MVRQDNQSIAALGLRGIVSMKNQQRQGLRGYRERIVSAEIEFLSGLQYHGKQLLHPLLRQKAMFQHPLFQHFSLQIKRK